MDTPRERKLAEISVDIYNLYWYHERSKDNFGKLCKLINRYSRFNNPKETHTKNKKGNK